MVQQNSNSELGLGYRDAGAEDRSLRLAGKRSGYERGHVCLARLGGSG